MTDKEKVLLQAFMDTIWMAMRYANGRSTYAPHMLRDAVQRVKKEYPEFKMMPDAVIVEEKIRRLEYSDEGEFGGIAGDWLDDLFLEESLTSKSSSFERYIYCELENFVDYYTSSETERERMKKCIGDYIEEIFEDHEETK